MPCFYPVDAYQLESGRITFAERGRVLRALKLRCGQCHGCRKDRAHEWAARILHESQMHRDSWFVTLTYDPAHVPQDGALNHRHFQLFIRAVRKKFGKVRYFMAGEYGTERNRPHFHAALFGLPLSDLTMIQTSPSGCPLYTSAALAEIWGRGFISIGRITFASAAYVASYVCKKLTGQRSLEYDRINLETGELYSLPPEYARMSLKPGIGQPWFDAYASDCLPRDHVIIEGRKLPVPRYYRKLFKERDPFLSDEVDFDRLSKFRPEDQTPARLAVRAECAAARLSLKKRKL